MKKLDSTNLNDPIRALAVTRLIWGAMVLGLATYFVVVMYVNGSREPHARSIAIELFYINFGLLVVGLFCGYLLRNQTYKRHWEGEVVTPKGYLWGNLRVWVVAEVCAILSVTGVLISGEVDPHIWPGVGGVVSLLINFPTGHIMFPPRDAPT